MPRKIIINLNGQKGNSFYLLNVARRFSKQLGLDMKQIHQEMTASDYNNLVNTFEKYFSNYITLKK